MRSLPPLGLPVFRNHRFVVVVGEWGIEPGFNDRLDGLGRVAGGVDPHVSFPQSEVAQGALDGRSLVDEGHDSNLLVAVWAQERMSFLDFPDEFAPLLGGDPAGLACRDVDDLAFRHGHGSDIRLLEPLAAHLIGILRTRLGPTPNCLAKPVTETGRS